MWRPLLGLSLQLVDDLFCQLFCSLGYLAFPVSFVVPLVHGTDWLDFGFSSFPAAFKCLKFSGQCNGLIEGGGSSELDMPLDI